MNPENNSLQRTFFIGGPPRVGKSLLSYSLSEKVKGHVVSTDSIRSAAKKATSDKNGDLFRINKLNDLTEQEWLEFHNNPEQVIVAQNKESTALWPSVVSFCNTFVEDTAVHIVEGVALLPSLVAEMKHRPQHIAFIGNTSENHINSMLRYGELMPNQDWMVGMKYSRERIELMGKFIRAMSLYFKSEAERYGLPYYEINDENFEASINKIVDTMV